MGRSFESIGIFRRNTGKQKSNSEETREHPESGWLPQKTRFFRRFLFHEKVRALSGAGHLSPETMTVESCFVECLENYDGDKSFREPDEQMGTAEE
jgi:hypothetical protein